MAMVRQFKRPSVDDPVLAKALQQIDDEFTSIFAKLAGLTGGSGDMTKAVYDTDEDDSVEEADHAADADDSDTVDGSHAAAFAAAGHGHTESEVASLISDLSGKAASAHGHAPGDVTGTAVVTNDSRLTDDRDPKSHGNSRHSSTFITAGDVHSNANDPSSGQKDALVGTSGTPGSSNKYVTDDDARMDKISSQWSTAIVSEDITNNDFDSFVGVPGLVFSLVSGHTYYFKFAMQVQTSSTTRGPRWKFTAPAVSLSHWSVNGRQSTAGTTGFSHSDAEALTTIINEPQSLVSTGTSYWVEIEGFCKPSENGSLELLLSTEIDGATITVKAGGIGLLCDLGV
jgi:hypothetical protein